MRKHFNHIFTLFLSAMMLMTSGMQVFAANTLAMETEPAIDTITLNSDLIDNTEVHADLGWKTKQDKGQWIEDLGIGEGVNSLVLVINNLDKENPDDLPKQEVCAEKNALEKNVEKPKKELDITGKSRLVYFSRNEMGEWEEFFSVEGFLSGDMLNGKEITYGVYSPQATFGVKENPGSLLPYQYLTTNDYWCLDPSDELFGNIVTVYKREEQPISGIKMESLKTFCNYGMILKPEMEGTGYPALVVNCLQMENNDGTFCGLQIPEQYMRILVQSLDENTRVIISDSLESLTGQETVCEE
ncbi:MAG: hypothetical protein IJO55_08580 [Lachnospiraceae bacterium]|nr:hypothetical protein [Lachnospiraceae bacterium]